MIEYKVLERGGDYVLLQLRGELAGQLWTESLRRALEEHFVDDGVRRIRLDLSPVSFLDNYGVATLVALQKLSRERGKDFAIEGSDGQAYEKLRVTGVLQILQGRAHLN